MASISPQDMHRFINSTSAQIREALADEPQEGPTIAPTDSAVSEVPTDPEGRPMKYQRPYRVGKYRGAVRALYGPMPVNLRRLNSRGGARHSQWQGGYQNFGSRPWATAILNRHQFDARKRNDCYPVYNADDIVALVISRPLMCAICGERLSRENCTVDHCHSTGKLRGLLCRPCNTGIGQFRDNEEIMKEAIAYVRKYT